MNAAYTLYSFGTPNGHKVSIMLEEIGAKYEVKVVDIENGGQNAPDFVALNPNRKIPMLMDHEANLAVIESGAILLHLAEKTGKLIPQENTQRLRVLQALFFQAAHVGPMLGQLWHFKISASEKIPYAINRYENEGRRVFRVIEDMLGDDDYVAGDYSIADIMIWPWIASTAELGLSFADHGKLSAWFNRVGSRPAVQRGVNIPPAHH